MDFDKHHVFFSEQASLDQTPTAVSLVWCYVSDACLAVELVTRFRVQTRISGVQTQDLEEVRFYFPGVSHYLSSWELAYFQIRKKLLGSKYFWLDVLSLLPLELFAFALSGIQLDTLFFFFRLVRLLRAPGIFVGVEGDTLFR